MMQFLFQFLLLIVLHDIERRDERDMNNSSKVRATKRPYNLIAILLQGNIHETRHA